MREREGEIEREGGEGSRKQGLPFEAIESCLVCAKLSMMMVLKLSVRRVGGSRMSSV